MWRRPNGVSSSSMRSIRSHVRAIIRLSLGMFSGEGVTARFARKLLEGSIVNVPPSGGRKHPEQKMIAVDTKNILFVCGGAFDGIRKEDRSTLKYPCGRLFG